MKGKLVKRPAEERKGKLSFASLFSGAGGLDLGFSLLNDFTLKFALELLNAPVKTYSINFRVPIYPASCFSAIPAIYEGDIELADFRHYNGNQLDVLIGGPPCQDFSVVRGPDWDRQGIKVKRGRLYQHFIRALKELRPKILVFENVPGLISANKGSAFQEVLKGFEESGWTVVFKDIVDSSWYGVPQRRKRILVIGIRDDIAKSVPFFKLKSLFEEQILSSKSLFKKYPLTPIEAFEGLPLPLLKDKYKEIMSEYERIIGKRKWSIIEDYFEANGIIESSTSEAEKAFEEHEKILYEIGWIKRNVKELNLIDHTSDIPEESPSVIERMKQIPPGSNHEYVRGTKWEVEGRGISLIYRRIHPLKPAYTVVAYGGGGTWGYHYERNRSKLSHRERARLQSFPDNFLFSGNSQEIRAQIGEAVPPLLAKKIATFIRNFFKEINFNE